MRLDRIITLGLAEPIGRMLSHFPERNGRPPSYERTLPVLMYHSISDDPEPAFSPYYKVCTSRQRFAEQMQWLNDAGWHGVALTDGLGWLNEKENKEVNGEQLAFSIKQGEGRAGSAKHTMGFKVLPPAQGTLPTALSFKKPVAITFDDGFRDFHTAAFPELHQLGFSATMYLPTAFIGENRQKFKSRECLSWPEIRELTTEGIEFGSHTVNHPKLTELAWAEIEMELRDSRVNIEQHLGRSAPSFAYPYAFPRKAGEFAVRFREILAQSGYESCATTTIGRARTSDDRLQIPRLPVNSGDDRALLNAKLNGAYDWLATPQQVLKNFKRVRCDVGPTHQVANPGE